MTKLFTTAAALIAFTSIASAATIDPANGQRDLVARHQAFKVASVEAAVAAPSAIDPAYSQRDLRAIDQASAGAIVTTHGDSVASVAPAGFDFAVGSDR